MADSSNSEFLGTLRSHLGAKGTPAIARDPVNQPMIRHWCDAMKNDHPIYTDPDYAAKSVHGEIVAPPTMLNAWNMLGNIERIPDPRDPQSNVITLLDDAGFTSVVATNCEQEYARYLRLGDELSAVLVLEDISEEKHTGLGIGHFVTTTNEYRNQHDEVVGRMRFRILKFRPGTGKTAPASEGAAPAARPAAQQRPETTRERRESTLRFAEVEVGEELPTCPIPITTTLIVACAIASRDYQDVHHDRDLAIERGSPDIFMNILTSSGLCGRYISDWAGPEALLQSLSIRLGAPNYPGDTMAMSGSVLSKEEQDGTGLVSVGLRGSNGLGDHVTGSVKLALPIGAGA